MRKLALVVLLLSLITAYPAWSQTFISSENENLTAPASGVVLNNSSPGSAPCALSRGWTTTSSAPQLSSPKFADLNKDGIDEILMTTYGIANPYGEGLLYVWDGAGNLLTGFPVLLNGALPASPAVGDIDGNGTVEIVIGTWKNLYVLNTDGTNYPGWPIASYITQTAALADLDKDDDLEIIVPSNSSINVYNHDTTMFPGFPVSGTNDMTSVAVGDLDGNGDLELVAGSFVASGSNTDYVHAWGHDGQPVTGFPVTTAGSVKSAPALADLDKDGTLEVIANCWNKSGSDFLYLWDHTGVAESGWPIAVPYIRLSSPSVADLDKDGDLEVIVGGLSSHETVNAYHHDGKIVAGFPAQLINTSAGNINSTCTVGDIDNDGYVEIVVKAVNNIFAVNHDGSLVSGFPVFLDDENHSGTTSPTPAIGDPDGDGLVEIFAASSFNNLALIDTGFKHNKDSLFWPTYRRDQYNSGVYLPKEDSLLIDVDTISESIGGVVNFTLIAGSSFANRGYLIFSGISGTAPGTLLPGGKLNLPLNLDSFTNLALLLLNSPYFPGFAMNLNSQGEGSAQFNTLGPLPSGAAGLVFYYAFVLYRPCDFASNSVKVTVTP